MFAVTVFFQIKPGAMAAFLPLMIENARTSLRDEAGCQQFDVCRKGDTVFLYEVYDDETAFETHLGTAHFQAFDTAVAEMVIDKRIRVYDEVMR